LRFFPFFFCDCVIGGAYIGLDVVKNYAQAETKIIRRRVGIFGKAAGKIAQGGKRGFCSE